MRTLSVVFYDGRSARQQTAELHWDDGEIVVCSAAGERRFGKGGVDFSEPLAGAPRRVGFPDGSSAEIADHAAFDQWLAAGGIRPSVVVVLQNHWRWGVSALLLLALLIATAYLYGLPALAKAVAPRLPPAWIETLSTQTLQAFDQQMLQPSKLPSVRQAAVATRWAEIHAKQPGLPAYRLHFRSANIGPNAIALPGGEIIVLDALVALAADDTEVAAVIAHELGHVTHQHGLRQLIQSSIVSFIVGSYFGDVSSIITGLGTLVLSSGYSRDFEREADAAAAATLNAAGLNAEPLARMLEKLAKQHAETEEGGHWKLLSSHPDTAERVRQLRR